MIELNFGSHIPSLYEAPQEALGRLNDSSAQEGAVYLKAWYSVDTGGIVIVPVFKASLQ